MTSGRFAPWSRRRGLVAITLASASAFGCRAWPARPVVADVEITGADEIDTDALESGLSTSETAELFGVIPRVFEYSTYDPAVLARDLERTERFFRARGYYEAKVRVARVVALDAHHVRVEIEVVPGEPVRVRRVDPAGIALLPADVAGPAVSAIGIREGEIFDEARFDADKSALLAALTDRGYAFAKITAKARVDIAAHAADISYVVELGPPARFGPITLVGLGEIPEGPVRANLGVEEGDRYSSSDLVDAQKALASLGVFSSVEVKEDRSRPESGLVPVAIQLRESNLRTVRLGGGGRLDVLRLSAHLQAGWEDRNFLGGMRRFGIDVRPGATFFPTRIPTAKDKLRTPHRVLPQGRVNTELRQPSFIEGRTAGFVSSEFGVYPVLYPLEAGTDTRLEPILGYVEVTAGTGVERAFLGQHLIVRPSYNWQAYFPFSYQEQAAEKLRPVRVSFPKLDVTFDYRDDPVNTKRGVYLTNSFEVAGYAFRGTVSDVRVRPEARVYTRGALGKRSVFAARLGFGFLFPRPAPGSGHYGETLDEGTAEASLAETDPGNVAVIRDQQKLLLRAFYSGGPSSNRGYPHRGVGPHGPIGFQIPTATSGVNCSLTGREVEDLPPECVRPLGGLTLWELSLETRFPIAGPIYGAIFVDASDVTRDVGHIRLDYPHLSPGFGLRYLTPVGPFRVDFGFRPPYLQAIGQKRLPEKEGTSGGLPLAIDVAIGEAF
jgi:outer membrane protein insertion porin family/translocation and assembly module TamA